MIDKSLRQYYENGKEVDPYRKGLEIIAGKGKDTIQTTAPGKITARNLIKPAEKMTLPSVRKDKTVPSITTLPKTARPSFDQKKYSGLASAFYDKLKEGEESYLDKYINRDPVRTAGGVEEWGKDYDYLTSSAAPDTALAAAPDTALAAAPDKLLAQLVTSPQTDTAITSTGEGETATSYTDTQMEDIFKSGDQETKNFITDTYKKVNAIIDDKLGENVWVKDAAGNLIIDAGVKPFIAKQLGIGSMLGIPGMIFGWIFDKLTGRDKDIVPKFITNLVSDDKGKDGKIQATTLTGEKVDVGSDEWKEDMDARDKEFEETGDYDVYSDVSSGPKHGPVGPGTVYDAEDYGDSSITDAPDIAPAPPAPTHYDEPSWSGDSGDSGDSGSSDDDGWSDSSSYIAKGGLAQRAPRKSMLKGGRVDKALTGRSRDI